MSRFDGSGVLYCGLNLMIHDLVSALWLFIFRFYLPPAALPGDQILKIWTNGFLGSVNVTPIRYPFIKLFKSLAPGRAAGGIEIVLNKTTTIKSNLKPDK
jgi:hypothetical protein